MPHYDSWRVLFYVASGLSLSAAAIRLALPESHYFLKIKAAAIEAGVITSSSEKTKVFLREAGNALKIHWVSWLATKPGPR